MKKAAAWIFSLREDPATTWGSYEGFLASVHKSPLVDDHYILESSIGGTIGGACPLPRPGDSIAFYYSSRGRSPRGPGIYVVGTIVTLATEGEGQRRLKHLVARIPVRKLEPLGDHPFLRKENREWFENVGIRQGPVYTFYPVSDVHWRTVSDHVKDVIPGRTKGSELYVAGYNRRSDGRHIWMVQANPSEGWEWEDYLADARKPEDWGGASWIRSTSSMKRVREEFGPGDIVVCYEAKPKMAVVGLARVASHGYGRRGRGGESGGSLFDLDWGCRLEHVPYADFLADPILAGMEKARISQGTVFRVSPEQFDALLRRTVPNGILVAQVEKALEITWPVDGPTSSPAELARRVSALLKSGKLPVPEGVNVPQRVSQVVQAFQRHPRVKAWVLQNARGVCELCSKKSPFVSDDGAPFLEVHHVVTLAEGGADTPANTVALCPNCHRHLHLGRDRAKRIRALQRAVPRLERGYDGLS